VDDVDGVALGGQHDDRDVGLGADLATHLRAVLPREHDVQEHEVGLRDTERGKGAVAVGTEDRFEVLAPQDDADHLRQRGVIVDDKDARLHATSLPGRSIGRGARDQGAHAIVVRTDRPPHQGEP